MKERPGSSDKAGAAEGVLGEETNAGPVPPITIAIDAMGGDQAPEEIVKAAAELSLERGATARGDRDGGGRAAALHLVLVGDAPRINKLLYEQRHDAERIAVHHASQAVAMDESPRAALESKPDASILVAARLCAEGRADALVSAGNTGAAVLACQMKWQRLPGVRRCALAAVYPTEVLRGEKDDPFSLILDVGATLDVTAEDLVTFAVMGSAYAARISKNPRPKVALLSNGAEAGKGPKEVVAAHARLKQHPGLHFIGNVEGVDIPRGSADVIVCSGFVGNVVLKMLEGVSETVVRLAHYAYKEKLMWRAGLAMLSGGFSKLKDLTDWKQYGGAPLLGFDHLLIKAHGRSQAPALKNAIKVAGKAVSSGLLDDIRTGLLQGGLVGLPEAIAPVSSGPLALAAAGVAAAASSKPPPAEPDDQVPDPHAAEDRETHG
ncbi:MAG: phosphate acyltransferase PlsX [Polyangia bacterium]